MDVGVEHISNLIHAFHFFYAKLFHEVAHACLVEMDRRSPDIDDDERFSSPATFALTGEVWNEIERHFFGSVVDAVGDHISREKNIFPINRVILREMKTPCVVTHDHMHAFIKLNLPALQSILTVTTRNHSPLSSIKRKRSNRYPSPKKRHSQFSTVVVETSWKSKRGGPENEVSFGVTNRYD